MLSSCSSSCTVLSFFFLEFIYRILFVLSFSKTKIFSSLSLNITLSLSHSRTHAHKHTQYLEREEKEKKSWSKRLISKNVLSESRMICRILSESRMISRILSETHHRQSEWHEKFSKFTLLGEWVTSSEWEREKKRCPATTTSCTEDKHISRSSKTQWLEWVE